MEKEKIKMSSKLWEDRAKSSLLFIPSDSIVKQLSIDEMGVNIYITPTNAVVSRNFAMNVFPNMGDDGISRPYIFLSDFVGVRDFCFCCCLARSIRSCIIALTCLI